MKTEDRDLTPLVDLTAHPGTGPQRRRRPVYVDLLPPCNGACPAGEDIQGWLAAAQAGRFREAWEILVRDNPLPAVHGRVCYHPCETGCNRADLDSSVSIHAVERFLGDLANAERWAYPRPRPDNGRRVLVVGAGPCGLSAAYHLRRLGYGVEIRDAGVQAGGMLHFGIPAYRLPRAELRREVERIEAMGVKITLGHRVDDVLAERAEGGFAAVFLALGAHLAKRVDIPARDAGRVLDAVTLLHRVGAGERPRLGRRVVVYGGGNTAMDAARTARRLGAEDAVILYHRDRSRMSAHAFEADEALAEGIRIQWLSSVHDIDGARVVVERMAIDDSGEPRPTGEMETLDADSVVLALGQRSDTEFLRGVPDLQLLDDGSIAVNEAMMTGHPGLFAGGDATDGERTVSSAVGQGKRAARHIDAWLRGSVYRPPPRHPPVSYDMLHLELFTDAEQSRQAEAPVAQRLHGFSEVLAGLDAPQARYEARRCLSCGNCFECDQCYAACPEQAIEKLGPGRRYRVDYDRCTGCAVCFEVCPCHAIDMVSESGTAPERPR
ncbi:MAG: glutamate synthase [Gammaproteobacteria bacterium]|nr:glutamate synthase [Gammaproteobacteria bacterium]